MKMGLKLPVLGMIVCAAFLSSFLMASQKTSEPNSLIKLEDYLTVAAKNNAGLKAAFEQWKSAVAQVPQARSLMDPEISYELDSEAWTDMDVLSIMQKFPWFGTLEARGNASAARAEAAFKRYQSARLKIFYDVKSAFYDYVYLDSAARIARENLELVRNFEQVATIKYQTFSAANPDVIRAQIELANLEYMLKRLEESRKPAAARLNALLNRKTDEDLPWPEKPKPAVMPLDETRIAEILKRNNPELAGLDYEIEAAKSEVTASRKRFYPELGIGVQRQQGMTTEPENIMLMFSMTLPVWRQNYRAGELQARAEERVIRNEKVNVENSLLAQAVQAIYDFEDSSRRMNLYSDNLIPKAEELVKNSEAAYRVGSLDFLSLIDAQRMLLDFKLSYEQSVTSNQQSLAELEMLIGEQLGKNSGNK
jgi:cobalt-zinc-cadmium efflux system outer membrane protein